MYGLCAIVCLLSAGYTNAATALYPVEEKPAELADQEGCYLKHLNKVIPYGDYYPEDSCSKYACFTSNITQQFTCGVQHVGENGACYLVSGDLERNYPDCCPWVRCHTIPPDAKILVKTSEGTSVTEETTQTSKTEASEAKPHEGPLSSEDAPVTELTTQAIETEAPRGAFDQEGSLAELLVAQASVNQ